MSEKQEERFWTQNIDVVCACEKIARVREEQLMSNSANSSSGVNSHDIRRTKAAIRFVKSFLAHSAGEPLLDLTESHPRRYEVPALMPLIDVENPNVKHLARMYEALWREVLKCESSRDANGFHPIETDKMYPILKKMRQFVEDHVEKQADMDFSKTSPKHPLVPAGRRGIDVEI